MDIWVRGGNSSEYKTYAKEVTGFFTYWDIGIRL